MKYYKERYIILDSKDTLLQADLFLREGRDVKILATGRSMFPFLISGKDVVTIRAKKEYILGDIILARINDNFILHRIYNCEGANYTLMGDGNLVQQEICTKEDICGAVIAIERDGKEVDINSSIRKFAEKIWLRTIPLRRIMLFILRQFKRECK